MPHILHLNGASVAHLRGCRESVYWHPGVLKSNSQTVKQNVDIRFSVDLALLL